MLTGIVAVAIGLGVMVLVHEWGHFVLARLFGVRVEVFSIGFGPRLFGVRRGPTDYRISALPLGGYVRMAGDNPAEERRGDPDEFLSKPRWQRCLIALAGPTTNFLMAVVLTAALFMHGGEQPSYADKPVAIAGVVKDSPADKAGIQAGDRIVGFDGVNNPTWDRVALELALSAPGHSLPVKIERNGQLLTTSVQSEPQPFNALGYPAEPVVVGAVSSEPARAARRFDGRRRRSWPPTASTWMRLRNSPNSCSRTPEIRMTLDLSAQRASRMSLQLRPMWGDPGDGDAAVGDRHHLPLRRPSPKRYSPPDGAMEGHAISHRAGRQADLHGGGSVHRQGFARSRCKGPLGIVQESSRAAQARLWRPDQPDGAGEPEPGRF